MKSFFDDTSKVKSYLDIGPPAFAPGHAGLLQMLSVLFEEHVPARGKVLVVGAGGGIEIKYLAHVVPTWRFVGVDPAPMMLQLAREHIGALAPGRLELIEGTVLQAPAGPYAAATCLLVLGLILDDGSKLATLEHIRHRLAPGAPFVLVDHCIDVAAADAEMRMDRYAAYARRSGIDASVVAGARDALAKMTTMVPAARNEALLEQAGFERIELFYVGMAWRGWLAYA